MNVKACFIGNSHLAAIKAGWDRLRDYYPDVDITFFGSKSRTLRTTYISDGKIVSDDSQVNEMLRRTGGTNVIDVGAFDVVCLVGLAFNTRQFVRFTKNYSLAEFDVPGTYKVSEGYLGELFEDRIRSLLVSSMLDLVIEAGGKKIFVMPEPNTSQFALTDLAEQDWTLLRMTYELGVSPRIYEIFKAAAARALGSRANVILQPDDTTFAGLFTRSTFSGNAEGLKTMLGGTVGKRLDTVHMNGDYGVIMINQFLEGIGVAINDEATSAATLNRIDEAQVLEIQKKRSRTRAADPKDLARRKALKARRARLKAREETAASDDPV
jgi:hypothetical protein